MAVGEFTGFLFQEVSPVCPRIHIYAFGSLACTKIAVLPEPWDGVFHFFLPGLSDEAKGPNKKREAKKVIINL